MWISSFFGCYKTPFSENIYFEAPLGMLGRVVVAPYLHCFQVDIDAQQLGKLFAPATVHAHVAYDKRSGYVEFLEFVQ